MGQRTIKGAAQQRRAHLQLGHQGGNIKVACWDRSPDPPRGGVPGTPPRVFILQIFQIIYDFSRHSRKAGKWCKGQCRTEGRKREIN